LIHAEQIDGPLNRQIDGAVAFVDRFMLKPATKTAGRPEYPQFAVTAVHEAIVNAVSHRDYSISGSKIRLFLFDNRLELISPGELPNTLTLETLPYRQFTRNQLLGQGMENSAFRLADHVKLGDLPLEIDAVVTSPKPQWRPEDAQYSRLFH